MGVVFFEKRIVCIKYFIGKHFFVKFILAGYYRTGRDAARKQWEADGKRKVAGGKRPEPEVTDYKVYIFIMKADGRQAETNSKQAEADGNK